MTSRQKQGECRRCCRVNGTAVGRVEARSKPVNLPSPSLPRLPPLPPSSPLFPPLPRSFCHQLVPLLLEGVWRMEEEGWAGARSGEGTGRMGCRLVAKEGGKSKWGRCRVKAEGGRGKQGPRVSTGGWLAEAD